MDETTDIPEAQAEDPEALRDALLDQIAYLVDEIEALETVVDSVPDEIKEGRPAPDALTMKELYGALAILDAEVRAERVEQMAEAETEPTFTPAQVDDRVREAGWNDRDMTDILERVKEARRRLVDRLDDLPLDAWHQRATLEDESLSLFQLVHRMTQEDVQRLRDLGYRLHGAHLSDRDEPLPT